MVNRLVEPSVSRRMRTAASDPVEDAKKARPTRTQENTPKRQQNLSDKSATFILKNGWRDVVVKLAFLPEGVDKKDDELTEKVIKTLGDRYLRIRDGAYRTENADIQAWLRNRIKTGRLDYIEEYIPPARAQMIGDEHGYFTEDGERLMTYDQFIQHQQDMAARVVRDNDALTRTDQARFRHELDEDLAEVDDEDDDEYTLDEEGFLNTTLDDHLPPVPDRSPLNVEAEDPPTPDLDAERVELDVAARQAATIDAAKHSTTAGDAQGESTAPKPAKVAAKGKSAPQKRIAAKKASEQKD